MKDNNNSNETWLCKFDCVKDNNDSNETWYRLVAFFIRPKIKFQILKIFQGWVLKQALVGQPSFQLSGI